MSLHLSPPKLQSHKLVGEVGKCFIKDLYSGAFLKRGVFYETPLGGKVTTFFINSYNTKNPVCKSVMVIKF